MWLSAFLVKVNLYFHIVELKYRIFFALRFILRENKRTNKCSKYAVLF